MSKYEKYIHNDDIPGWLNVPCCKYIDAYVGCDNLDLIRRATFLVKYTLKWRCTHRTLVTTGSPKHYIFIAEEDLNNEQKSELKDRKGPTIQIAKVLVDLEEKLNA